MNKDSIKFDLVEVVRIALKWKWKILLFAFLVASIMAAYAYSLKNRYTSYANFYPANALIGSRDNLFRKEFQDAIDMFGLENEIDRIYTIGNSAPILSMLIEKYKLAEHYKIDVKNDTKGMLKVYKKFDKMYNVSKGAFGNIELNVTETDPQLGYEIAQSALEAIQDNFRSYYVNSSKGISDALNVRMLSMDSTIALLTDSLVNMRNKYGIFDIISPSRKSDVSVNSTNARGIEEIQTVEELKDKMVMEKANYAGIQNEFLTIQHKSIPFIHVVQYPTPSGKKDGPFRTLMVLGAGVTAVILGLLFALIVEYLGTIKHLFIPKNANA
jgi:hypothetical protein